MLIKGMRFFAVFFILCGCASDTYLISKGKLYVGMTQNDLYEAFILSDIDSDVFLMGCYRKYIDQSEINILAAEKKEYYYIFEDVDKPSLTCDQIGNGTLMMILNEMEFEVYNNSIR